MVDTATTLGPVVILARVSTSISCFLRPSIISKGVLWIVGPSSLLVLCFSWKGGTFPCKIQFFWYFSDFQRPVLVRSASMTNKKLSGGVVCYYCHNLVHVRRKCRRLQHKNQRFQSSQYQKSLKSASTSITTLVESGKINTCFISSSSTFPT